MEINDRVEELGDPEFAGKYIEKLGITRDDFADPERALKIKDIIDYLKEHPDPDFLLYKSVGSKQVDRVEFLNEYIQFHKEHEGYAKKLNTINEKISKYNSEGVIDPLEQDVYQMLLDEKATVREKIDRIQQEIQIYEK